MYSLDVESRFKKINRKSAAQRQTPASIRFALFIIIIVLVIVTAGLSFDQLAANDLPTYEF